MHKCLAIKIMNNLNLLKQYSLLFLSAIAMYSCSSMNGLTIPVLEPAPVTLDPTIQSVGILNRSMPSPENAKMDEIDKILSVEGVYLDRDGAQQLISGLVNELYANGRFEEIIEIKHDNLRNPGSGVYPAALPWESVHQMCEEYGVDAILVLSFYDTDTKVDYQAVPVTIAGPLGVNLPALEHRARTTTVVKSGWRIYDAQSQYLSDEWSINDVVEMTGTGINPVNAIKAITTGRKENVMQASSEIGRKYAWRLMPYRRRVGREYYVRGTDNFKVARRRAQTGNWDGAAELWNMEVSNAKSKIAGRAHYNMAIISEINGDLDAAIDWASKSYADFRIREALSYLKILRNRVYKNELLREQSGENVRALKSD